MIVKHSMFHLKLHDFQCENTSFKCLSWIYWYDSCLKTKRFGKASRGVLKENTTCAIATCQYNDLLLWHTILNHMV